MDEPRYSFEGNRYYSVTQILSILPKLELKPWLDRTVQPDREKAESALKGQIVHYRIAQSLADEFNLPPQTLSLNSRMITKNIIECVNHLFEQWKVWRSQHELKVVWIEKAHYSPSLRYAGTPDLLAYLDGILSLIDWKTSKFIYDTYAAQLAAYKRLITELPQKLIVVKLNETTGTEMSEMDDDWTTFERALAEFAMIKA